MIQIFQYNNSNITFKLENGEVMVNATEMARPFGKEPYDYLKTSSTQEFINELASQTDKSRNDLVQVVRGGAAPGTWLHEDIAIDFSQWLYPGFRVWCNLKIKELLKTGKTEIAPPSDLEYIAIALQKSAKIIEMKDNQINMLTQDNEMKDTVIKEQAPKVKYFHDVIDSAGLIPMTVLAQGFGMTVDQFKKELIKRGILWKKKVGGVWALTAKYQGRGYSHVKPFAYTDSLGISRTKNDTYFTQKFREFLHSVFNSNSNAA